MRLTRALSLAALMVLVVACGGGGPAASLSSTESEQSTSADPSTAASEDVTETPAGNGGDVESLAAALVPPNSTEVSNTSAEGISFIIYESTDSVESLQSFYESAIPAAGMEIISTTTTGGNVGLVFAESEGSLFGGAVNIFPSSTGGGGSGVQVTVGDSS